MLAISAIATVTVVAISAIVVVVVDDNAKTSPVSLTQWRLARQFAQDQRLCGLFCGVHLMRWEKDVDEGVRE